MNCFKEVSKDYLSHLKATGTLYKHSSGFEVYHIDVDDEELFFSYSFTTYPSSSNGVFHILEHTILSGSEKYQLKDPFNSFLSSSCNTFLNALTFPDKTLYPAASALKKDFDNIFDLYTDAVFRPLLRKESFLSEGVRVNKDSFDGVVFNEMRSDTLTHEAVVASQSIRNLFSSSPYCYSSGGDAKEIARLTYEEYLAAYDKYYHPSNGKLFFYGKSIDINAKLSILEEYLKDTEYREPLPLYEKTEAWEMPRSLVKYSSANESDKRITVISSFLTKLKATSSYDRLFLSILVDALLATPSSAFYSLVLQSEICDDISSQSGMSGDFYEIPFSIGLTGVKEENIEKAQEFILKGLEKLANEGIDRSIIEASIRRQEFLIKEIPGSLPNGFRVLLRMLRSWIYDSSAIKEALDIEKHIKTIRELWQNDNDIFSKFIKSELLDNPHRLDLVVKPSFDILKEEDEELKRAAREEYLKIDQKDYDAYKAFMQREDDVNTLPSLRISDIPLKSGVIEYTQRDQIIVQKQLTGGISYLDIAIDFSDLSPEELRYLSLFSRLIPLCSLVGDSSREIHKRLRLLTGGMSYHLETGRSSNKDVKAYFVIRSKYLSYNAKEVVDSLSQLLTSLDLTKSEIVKSAINDICNDFKENVEYSGSSFSSSAALAALSPSLSLAEDVMGLKAFSFFDSVELEKAKESICRGYSMFNNRSRYILHYTIEEQEEESSLKLGEMLLSSLKENNPIKRREYQVNESDRSLFYPISAPIAFNTLASLSSPYSSYEQACEEIFSQIMSSGALWTALRSKGGSYGVEMLVDILEEAIIVSTSNDPHLKSSYELILETIKSANINDKELEGAKLTILGRLLKPLSPSIKAMVGFRRYLYNISDEMRQRCRDNILSVTKESLESTRERVYESLKSGSRCSISSRLLFDKDSFEATTRKLLG